MNILEKILRITNVSFKNQNTLILDLSNKRSVQIPLNEYPEIAALTSEEREDFEIIDGEYLSFIAIDEIYHLNDLIGIRKIL